MQTPLDLCSHPSLGGWLLLTSCDPQAGGLLPQPRQDATSPSSTLHGPVQYFGSSSSPGAHIRALRHAPRCFAALLTYLPCLSFKLLGTMQPSAQNHVKQWPKTSKKSPTGEEFARILHTLRPGHSRAETISCRFPGACLLRSSSSSQQTPLAPSHTTTP